MGTDCLLEVDASGVAEHQVQVVGYRHHAVDGAGHAKGITRKGHVSSCDHHVTGVRLVIHRGDIGTEVDGRRRDGQVADGVGAADIPAQGHALLRCQCQVMGQCGEIAVCCRVNRSVELDASSLAVQRGIGAQHHVAGVRLVVSRLDQTTVEVDATGGQTQVTKRRQVAHLATQRDVASTSSHRQVVGFNAY